MTKHHNHQSSERPHNTLAMLQPLIIITLLVSPAICVPNQPNQQQQQHQRNSADYDKQLLRKALDGAETSGSSSTSSLNAATNFQCPEQFGYYTDTRDCTKYYVCVFGEVLHESCTGGLRFSRELQTCDWPRNVDCPQLNGSQLAAQTTTPQTIPTTITATVTTPTSTTSTSSSALKLSQLNSISSNNAKEEEAASGAEGEERATLKGASLVFADEGSDPQQPSFDEAVSPVITSDGAIHLHDGSGGTFSLTPNHNRQLQPQQATDNERQNVDVFVKPLLTQQQQQQATSNNRRSNQQVSSLNNVAPRSQPKLQAPNVAPRTQQQHNNQQAMHGVNNINNQVSSSTSFKNDRNNNNNNDLSDESESVGNDEPNDSISALADQESNENQDSPASSGVETSENGDNDSSRETQAGAGAAQGYIPPVMAPNTHRQVNNLPLVQTGRQSSQLLSINNRQVDSRQSFKPILFNQLVPSSHPNNNGNSNQRNRAHQSDSMMNNNNNNSDMSGSSGDEEEGEGEGEEEQPVRSVVGNNNNNNNKRFKNQTLPLIPSQKHQHQQMVAAAAASAMQNNRQSRMSNFQQQSFSTVPQQARFSSPQQQTNQQTLSSNVNFNDSSKLIRLQASQFEPMQPPMRDLSLPTLSGRNFLNKPLSSQQPPQPQQQQQMSRSQNVLFSQSPFGLVAADSNSNDNQRGAGTFQLDGANRQTESSFSLNSINNPNTSLLQQQRRPRPPKRQQIPAGAGRRPAGNTQQPRNQFIDTTTTTTTSTQPTTANSFLSAHDPSSFVDSAPDSDNNQPDETSAPAPPTPTRSFAQNGRPIVASTTINFQQQDKQPTTTATFATSVPSSTSRRFNIDNLSANGGLQNLNQIQGQRSAQLQAETLQPVQTPPTISMTTNPIIPTTTTSNQQEQDPQLVANRYLNSAIDALEAGQPFGTVDYDFDILNDNSTDRRNPTGLSAAGFQTTTATTTPIANNQTTSSSSPSNSNQSPIFNGRQRQPQTFSLNDGENISLTNGQPNGGQIGLNMRPQQVVGGSSAQSTNGRIRAQGNVNRQQQFSSDSFPAPTSNNNNNNLPQTAPISSSPSSSSSSSSPSTNQQQAAPTKKPRPTNKKITVNHEQALANNRASIEPAKRPEALFSTPIALQTATKCDNRICRLPDCKCGDTLNPGGLDPKVIPQVILLTFDDAVNDLNWEIYEELFTGRTNPNGCPILATFYVSHEWTDYGQVQTLYSRGHEMASHSVTHSFGEKFSKSQWFKEVNGQREILNMYGGVKMNDVRGMRAPFLQIGGNKMFEMLYDANFTYDSSMPIFENSPPLWPYTLDYQLAHECMITPCPTKSFPGVWEVGMTMWVDLRGGRCSMGDACSNPPDEDGVYEMLMKNFNRHYKSNRAPFGLFYHSAWFNTVHHRRGFIRFMGTVNALSDVFFVTNWQMLQWMRKPTPLSEINSFEPWQCPAKNDRPPPCFHPSVCNVKSEHGTRFMKTCQPCPANQQYPWVGSTGFKAKQANANGSG